MDSQILSKSTERSDAASTAGSSGGCGCLQVDAILSRPMQQLTMPLGVLNKACGAALVLTGGWGAIDALRAFNLSQVRVGH